MAMQNTAAVVDAEQPSSRNLDTLEFLTRLAEEMRITSGSDLPLSCFVEQVKLQLAGGKSPEELQGGSRNGANGNAEADYQSADCFKAWAMPD